MNNEFLKLREQSGLSVQEVADKCGVALRTVYRWDRGESKAHPLAIQKLKDIIKIANSTNPVKMHDFRFIDLFAGIGGFRKAFDTIGGKCVFTSEWDKSCRTTYQANYVSDHPVEGD